jgi:hypothetical protein
MGLLFLLSLHPLVDVDPPAVVLTACREAIGSHRSALALPLIAFAFC